MRPFISSDFVFFFQRAKTIVFGAPIRAALGLYVDRSRGRGLWANTVVRS
jgi:hypothetical protein